MSGLALTECVAAILDKSGIHNGALMHKKSGLHLLRYDAISEQDVTVYHPLFCLVLQGEKEVKTAGRTFAAKMGQSLIVSHTVPIVSKITEASSDQPYIALVLPLDLDVLRSFGSAVIATSNNPAPNSFSMSLVTTDNAMQDALTRLLLQSENEETRRLLVPITKQEIHSRLLLGAHAETLRKLLWHENSASRISRATQEIRENLTQAIAVGNLAQLVGMSKATFFEHFKSITGTSPLQFQKDLRLLKARDWLRSSNEKVSEVAFRVGYESSTQFSREYLRKFGNSPKSDRKFV